ncbi:MAG: exosortase O [Myxococcota bacterium]
MLRSRSIPSAPAANGSEPRRELGPWLQLALLVGGWVALFRSSLHDLLAAAAPGTLRQNTLLGLALGALVLYRARQRPSVSSPVPRLRLVPLAVIAVSLVAHVVLRRAVDSDLLSCIGMVMGAYGVAGLYLSATRWRQALPLALAGVCVLPMGAALDIYLGFPLRLATAELVHATLQPLGLQPTTTETIVLVEGAGIQVDLPCSGVRSLWSGAVLWTAATWIERRRVGLPWVFAGLLFAGLIVAFNGARVLVLVLLHGTGQTMAMDILHVPLGLCAFATACALGFVLLQRLPAASPSTPAPPPPGPRPRWPWGLAAGLWLLSVLPIATPRSPTTPQTITLDDPALTAMALRPDEASLFATRHASAAGKWSFDDPAGRGQLLMVEGRSWRSQHRPDICHEANGRHVEQDDPVLLAPGIPIRQLRLRSAEHVSVAFYWFQSAEQTTNEYGTRIWAAFDGDAEPWVMVSVMFDAPRSLDDPKLRALLRRAHRHAHTRLTASAPASP